MKFIFQIILLCCFFLNSHAQNDKIQGWELPQKGIGEFSISKNSKKIGKYYYDRAYIKPEKITNLHIEISTHLPVDTFFTKEKYTLQIKSNYNEFVNKQVEYDGLFTDAYAVNISLTDMDTIIMVDCFRPSYINDTIKFEIKYTLGDTAALDYSNKKPQDVFNRMLELATVGYTNLTNVEVKSFFSLEKKINYPDGLFEAMPAIRYKVFGSTDVTQYTAYKLKSKVPADEAYTEWNKKIAAWLKDYKITDVKRGFDSYEKPDAYDEKTTYIKNNAAGKKIFEVEVFKELRKITGTETNFTMSDIIGFGELKKTPGKETNKTPEEFYFSGVRISGNE